MDFPAELAAQQDSKFYNVTREDPAIKSSMEGGYVVSRPRHTRIPRRTFTTGFTGLTDQLKLSLESFYELVRGPSNLFNWMDPVTGIIYSVRFTDKLDFKYTGIGFTKLWDVTFTLEQV